jgi:hypothetical protein
MIYLAKGKVYHTLYEGKTNSFDDLRIIEAVSETEAWDKYSNYWSNRGQPYGDSYHIVVDYVHEMIT